MEESLNNFNGLIDDEFIRSHQFGYYTPEASNDIVKSFSSNCDLSILHINIRSLNANYFKLLDFLSLYSTPFDIIVLSEIWNTNIEFFDNLFPEYQMTYCAPQFQRAGGIALLIRNSLSFKIIDSTKMLNFLDTSAEYIVADVETNRGSIRFYAIYRHPSRPIPEFIDLFLNFLNNVRRPTS